MHRMQKVGPAHTSLMLTYWKETQTKPILNNIFRQASGPRVCYIICVFLFLASSIHVSFLVSYFSSSFMILVPCFMFLESSFTSRARLTLRTAPSGEAPQRIAFAELAPPERFSEGAFRFVSHLRDIGKHVF